MVERILVPGGVLHREPTRKPLHPLIQSQVLILQTYIIGVMMDMICLLPTHPSLIEINLSVSIMKHLLQDSIGDELVWIYS